MKIKNMNTLYGDNIGLTHFIAGVAAVLFGGAVLLMKSFSKFFALAWV
ncbi:MAG: hypothetical protein U5L45_01135 [Saprospiraceae bacterium]|nr:hypothetical protein [Saprospiraceae bacterium]